MLSNDEGAMPAESLEYTDIDFVLQKHLLQYYFQKVMGPVSIILLQRVLCLFNFRPRSCLCVGREEVYEKL